LGTVRALVERLGMPQYAEFGQNTFVGSPAQAQAHVSSPTAQGFFAIFAWFDFEEGGGAVFELRLSVLGGITDVLRRGACTWPAPPRPAPPRRASGWRSGAYYY
jgi:hypothetical protein